jgi:hypothetical protein
MCFDGFRRTPLIISRLLEHGRWAPWLAVAILAVQVDKCTSDPASDQVS